MSLFGFNANNATFVIQSLNSLDLNTKLELCRDKQGSRVIDAFFDSVSIKIKHKLEFINELRGKFGQLGLDNISSHCLERMYDLSDLSLKEIIAKELAAVYDDLAYQYHGKFVMQKVQLDTYINSRATWKKHVLQHEKKHKQQFVDIIGGEGTKVGKKKRKKIEKKKWKYW